MLKIDPFRTSLPPEIAELADDHPVKQLLYYEMSSVMHITVVVCWDCNLNCLHCNVRHHIDAAPPKEAVNFEKLERFFARLAEEYPWRNLEANLIGGELFMYERFAREAVKAVYGHTSHLSTTTNLTVLPKDLGLLQMFDNYQVSVDGLPEDHDRQRGKGTFRKTLKNLFKMRELDIIDRVHVSSCLMEMDHVDRNYINKFKVMIASTGVPWDKIYIGSNHPTSKEPEKTAKPERWREHPAIFYMPCCGSRYMQSMCITPDGKIWSNYYGVKNIKQYLGTLDSSIEEIRHNYHQAIIQAPFFRDKNCLSCEALDHCWGLHCHARFQFMEDPKPSEFCNQQAVIELARRSRKDKIMPTPYIFGVSNNSINEV